MSAPQATSFPFEVLAAGVASVAADGELLARNEAMRALLAGCGEGGGTCRSLRTLPLDAAQRGRLEAGEPVALALHGGEHELQLVGSGDGRWLCAHPVGEGGGSSRLAAARARHLGRLAGAIAHELNNLLGSAMGLASLLAPVVSTAADRQLVDELQRGAQRGGTLARALARLLKVGPRQRQAVPLSTLVDEMIAVCNRSAHMRQVELAVHVAASLPRIRVVAAEAVQAMMHGKIALLDAGARRVVVTADALTLPLGGGRERECVRVRVRGEDCAQPVGSGDATPVDWFMMAQLAMRSVGGDVAIVATPDGSAIDYVWPAVVGD